MARDDLHAILEALEARLSGLDHLTRRQVLRTLLKNSAFLALLAGSGAAGLAPALAEAQRRSISAGALAAPPPDPVFRDFRTRLAEGEEAVLNDIIREILPELEALMDSGRLLVGPIQTDASSCTGFTCGGHTCTSHECTPRNTCTNQNPCVGLICPSNRCTDQTCGGMTGVMTPSDFFNRYAAQPFIIELRELFGQNVVLEVEGMIRNNQTLRGRGLIAPGAPPPPATRPPGDLLRDLAGERLRRIPPVAPPAAPKPVVPKPIQ